MLWWSLPTNPKAVLQSEEVKANYSRAHWVLIEIPLLRQIASFTNPYLIIVSEQPVKGLAKLVGDLIHLQNLYHLIEAHTKPKSTCAVQNQFSLQKCTKQVQIISNVLSTGLHINIIIIMQTILIVEWWSLPKLSDSYT